MNELQVTTNIQAGSINFNFEETKAELESLLLEYQGAVFTDESIPVAKSINADLRKKQKSFDARRKEVKNEFMKPYNEFDSKAKELILLFDEPINFIDTQVKAYEEKKKEEKRKKIQEIYTEFIGEMAEYLPLAKIYNAKWENSTTTIKSIKEDISQVVESTEQAVSTITGMNSEASDKALAQYKQDLSLANAISYINRYEQQKAEIEAKLAKQREEEEERKKLAEIERIRAEERKKIQDEERIRREEQEKAAREIEEIRQAKAVEVLGIVESDAAPEESTDFNSESFDTEEPLGELPFVTVGEIKSVFTVVATANELNQIEMYMNSIGVHFVREDD